VTGALTRPPRYDLESFARVTGLHPDLVRRFVALGLIEATRDATGELWFVPDQIAAAARIRRLRAGLSLNYAALGVVIDLLDRVAELEAALHTRARRPGGTSWTPND
jgi:DNA-binding transcriptional MerR regulator